MHPTLKLTVIVLLSLSSALSFHANAAEKVITQDGREILLKDDGTWEFLSHDRYANTEDGRRVRLKADNTWEYIGNAPMSTEKRVRDEISDYQLQKVEFEAYEEKVHKNERVITQTVFYLDIDISPLARQAISITTDSITVMDNRGNHYPVISISPSLSALKPGSHYSVIIRADGSPQWWSGIKTMILRIQPGLSDKAPPVELTYRVSDIERIIVDELPAN